ncbi:MAG: response regulator [Lentisphaerota bacterium]
MATIWVVDDEESIRDILDKLLQRLGHKTQLFENAESALKEFKPGSVDAMIVDIRMPGMDGIAFTKAILEQEAEASVIMLTGYPSVDIAVEAMQVGAVDFLSKPCNLGELRVRLNRALEIREWQLRLKRSKVLTLSLLISLPLWVILGALLLNMMK